MYFLDLGPSGQNLTLFFGLIFIFLNLFTYYMYAYNWSKNLNTFSLINFLNNLSFISMYSLKCFLWPRWLQDSLRLIQDQFGVVIQNKSSITHTRIRSGIFISAVLWSEGRFLGKSGTEDVGARVAEVVAENITSYKWTWKSLVILHTALHCFYTYM